MISLRRAPGLTAQGALLVLAALGCRASVAGADSVAVVSARDNTLYESTTGLASNGAGDGMFAGRNNAPSNSRRRAIVFFDVAAAVPAGATVTGVTLRLVCDQAASALAQPTELHALTASWGEGTSNAGDPGGTGAPSTTGDATWIHRFFNTVLWTTPGGNFSPAASAVIGVAGTGAFTWGSTPGMVADVQGWLDGPATNLGWIVIGNELAGQTATRFATHEALDAATAPTLTVTYTPPATPTLPSSWGRVKGAYR